jgi:hypothetical protein
MVQEEWKDFFTAGLRQARMVRGLERRTVVFVGMGTSELTREEFADLIELMYHFGAEHKVRWSEKSLEAIAAMRSTEEEK